MSGYTQQQKETGNDNPQVSFLDKEIEDYTIKDCEDFLARYPKDPTADNVRKRLEQLQPKNIGGGTSASKPNKKPVLSPISPQQPLSPGVTPCHTEPSILESIWQSSRSLIIKAVLYAIVFGLMILVHKISDGDVDFQHGIIHSILLACCWGIWKMEIR